MKVISATLLLLVLVVGGAVGKEAGEPEHPKPEHPKPEHIGCASDDRGAKCVRNPCTGVKLPAKTLCVPNYCTKATKYQGQAVKIKPCTAVLVDDKFFKIKHKEDDVCSKLYKPVCGKNRKTYANECTAKKAGVKYTEGPCFTMCTLLCTTNKTCAKSTSRCKGNTKLRCAAVRCPTQHLTAAGKVVSVKACSVAYFSKTTGYIDPSCTV